VRVADFDFSLPPELIASRSVEPRDQARLLVHDRETRTTEHAIVAELPRFLRGGDLLVLNDTRVMPWRLCGKRATGGAVECLLVRLDGDVGEAFVKPSKKLKPGDVVPMEGGAIAMTLLERRTEGRWLVQLAVLQGTVAAALERCGRAPLPPYIERDGDEDVAADRARYQTVYARVPGAIAAPTAGLHFTPELLQRLADAGIATTTVTLHVGEGTFAPMRTEVVEQHVMHSETYELPPTAAAAIAAARARGNRVVAIGTTSCRTLETCAAPGRLAAAGTGSSQLFLYPGKQFQVVDALFTNFHLPQSTLLMLVAAFAGHQEVLALYREAVARRYRFFSFGDAMLLL
jgi:S-adenosylmethionine:tRNA ribosyltransferase-isomerase